MAGCGDTSLSSTSKEGEKGKGQGQPASWHWVVTRSDPGICSGRGIAGGDGQGRSAVGWKRSGRGPRKGGCSDKPPGCNQRTRPERTTIRRWTQAFGDYGINDSLDYLAGRNWPLATLTTMHNDGEKEPKNLYSFQGGAT